MPDSQQPEPHEQDDCEDCQKQRAQNNQLIDFYERLNKIKQKVSKIKPTLSTHGGTSDNNQHKLSRISEKITKPPHLQLKGIDDKEMGYELACALLERQIKMKRENAMLNKKIQQMKQANAQLTKQRQVRRIQDRQSESASTNSFYSSPIISGKQYNAGKEKDRILDSLDNAVEKKGSQNNFWGFQLHSQTRRQRNKERSRYNDSLLMEDTHTNTNSSSISSFEYTGRTSTFKAPNPELPKPQPNKYDKMNLWLYQFNVEDEGPVFVGLEKTRSPPRRSKY